MGFANKRARPSTQSSATRPALSSGSPLVGIASSRPTVRFGSCRSSQAASSTRRVAIRGSRQATLVGEHLSAIGTYLGSGDGNPLRRLAGKSVTGTLPDGRSYRFELETNLDEIAELAFSGELSDLVVES